MATKKSQKKTDKNTIEYHRKELALIDEEIITWIFTRNQISEEIAKIKFKNGKDIKQPDIWAAATKVRNKKIKKLHLNKKFMKKIFDLIHKESVKIQHKGIKQLRHDEI